MAVLLGLVVMLKGAKYIFIALAIFNLAFICFCHKASALSGITISPFIQKININQNDTKKTYNLNLKNNTPYQKEVDLTVEDFGSLNNTGGVLLEGSNNYTKKYGLASWITLGTDTVNLGANQSTQVPITIENRSDLTPGGHYGAVIASVNSLKSQSGDSATINQQLLSLIFADKVGGEHFALNLTKVSNDGNWFHYPHTVTLEFQNPGNVEVTPRGIVELQSSSGKIISRGIINQGSGLILPDSFYDMYVPLNKVGSSLPLPGLYKIVVYYRYDQISNYAKKTSYLNFISLGMYLAILGLIVISIISFKFIKKRRP